MVILDTTTKSLQIILGGAVTTNELVYTGAYADLTSSGTTLAEVDGVTTGGTAVTAVAAPAASTARKVLYLNVYNADTVTAVVTIRINNNGTFRNLVSTSLATGSTLVVNNDGWKVIDTWGQFVVTTSTGGAPTDADYLVKTANASLSAERVVTDGTSITADWAVAGQVTLKRAALTGDVTASADSNATTIANDAVTYAKIQNVTTDRLLGRDTAGSGDTEEIAVGGGIEFSGSTSIQTSVTVNAQTGTTYTVLTGDRAKLVTHTNASAIAVTLPQATGNFGAGWYYWAENRGAGTVTITPTTSTIDGAVSLALTTNQGALIVSDGTNYFTMRGIGGGSGTPGGSDTQVQFNDGGSFGGDAGLTYNKTTDALTLAGLLNISGAAAGQIQFPASQNASSNANTLDDYEEGTWTPVLGGDGGTSGQTYSAQSGNYVKIGRLVTAFGSLTLTAKGTITGNLEIQGLPFTSTSGTAVGTGHLGKWTALGANYVELTGTVNSSATTCGLYGMTSSSGTGQFTTAAVTDTTAMTFTIKYYAAS